MRSALLMVIFVAGVTLGVAPASAQEDVCALLAADDIRAVQGSALKDQKSSTEQLPGLRVEQCFFAAADFPRSVSLTVITRAEGAPAGAVRAYWDRTFRAAPKPPPTSGRVPRKKDPPRVVEAAGEEAFWTGDPRSGALYVLDGDAVLRISVGGVPDEDERLRRSVRLAKTALQRLNPSRS